jgi:hypothetical protein
MTRRRVISEGFKDNQLPWPFFLFARLSFASCVAYHATCSEIQTQFDISTFPPATSFPAHFFSRFFCALCLPVVRAVMAKASKSNGKKTGRIRKKTAAALASEAQQSEASGDEIEEHTADTTVLRAPVWVVWDKYPVRTERLLDYLDAHPEVAIKLFGDSTKAAKLEGRSKLTAKSNKGTGYLQLADGIFSVDEDKAVRTDFAANPNKYAKAVDNYITNT